MLLYALKEPLEMLPSSISATVRAYVRLFIQVCSLNLCARSIIRDCSLNRVGHAIPS